MEFLEHAPRERVGCQLIEIERRIYHEEESFLHACAVLGSRLGKDFVTLPNCENNIESRCSRSNRTTATAIMNSDKENKGRSRNLQLLHISDRLITLSSTTGLSCNRELWMFGSREPEQYNSLQVDKIL